MNTESEAAWNVYLSIPVRSLDVTLSSGHVGQLRPSLRCGIPTPEVIQEPTGIRLAAINVSVAPVGAPPGAIARGGTSLPLAPSAKHAAGGGGAGGCRGRRR